jgi:hypothetical protein
MLSDSAGSPVQAGLNTEALILTPPAHRLLLA